MTSVCLTNVWSRYYVSFLFVFFASFESALLRTDVGESGDKKVHEGLASISCQQSTGVSVEREEYIKSRRTKKLN